MAKADADWYGRTFANTRQRDLMLRITTYLDDPIVYGILSDGFAQQTPSVDLTLVRNAERDPEDDDIGNSEV